MRPIQITVLLLSLFFFASCDPYGCDDYVVQNNSSKTIYAQMGGELAIDSSTGIAPGQYVSYYKDCGLGRGSGNSDPNDAMNPWRLYRVTRDDSSVSKKNLLKYSNWLHTKNKKRDYTHTFAVTDADFQ